MDKELLLKLQQEKAYRMLSEADDMVEQKRWGIAANRYYYPDIVLSLLGAGTPVSDDDLNARKAYNEYLEEKYT